MEKLGLYRPRLLCHICSRLCNYITYKNQQFLYNVVFILKLEIFALRYFTFFKCNFKKRKNSRFFLIFKKT